MSSAAQSVLGTAELLEAILYALPTKDLLLAQRTCKTWRDAIVGSKKIQEALFLRPIAILEAVCGLSIEGNLGDEDLDVDEEEALDETWRERTSKRPIKRLLGNRLPFLHDACYFDLSTLSALHESASCHRMLISQPAVTSCQIMLMGRFKGIIYTFQKEVQAERGVTIGSLIHYAIEGWPKLVAASVEDATADAEEAWGQEIQESLEPSMAKLETFREVEEGEQEEEPHLLLAGIGEDGGVWSWLTDNTQLDELKECIKNGKLLGETETEDSTLENGD